MKRRRQEEKFSLFSKRNAIGLIIIAIMVLSALGFMIGERNNTNSDTFNGHQFVSDGGYWYTNINNQQVKFRFHPSVVDNIILPDEARNSVKGTLMTYLTYDSTDKNIQYIEEIRLELEKELPELLKIYVSTGVTNATGAYSSFNTISCDNATASIPVIYFRTDINESFEYSGNCLIVKASTGNDMFIMKDRLLLGLTGIVNNTAVNTTAGK